jgi:hypothetical protein
MLVDRDHAKHGHTNPRIAPIRREVTHLLCPISEVKLPICIHCDIGTLTATSVPWVRNTTLTQKKISRKTWSIALRGPSSSSIHVQT